MKKILIIAMAIFAIALMGAVSATVPLTMVSGKVVDASNVAVVGTGVDVKCTHLGVDTIKTVTTDSTGMYYAFFNSLECNTGDTVKAHTSGADDTTGIVAYSRTCKINTLKLDLQIPEFGVIAGAVALVGELGIFV